MARVELARFLRERREGVAPEAVGLFGGGVRRTPGLRREEVARLASVSVDYYVRMEQARGSRPSAGVLEGVSGALRLSAAERRHLFRLAGVAAPAAGGPVRVVRPHVAALLERVGGVAALVTDATYEVVAANSVACAVFGGWPGNLARARFLGDGGEGGGGGMTEVSGGEEFGAIVVARLRRASARYPGDARLSGLLGELRAGSAEFRAVWDSNPVREAGHRRKVVAHPEVGELRVACDVLEVPEDDQQVVFVTADPGSASEAALRELAGRGAGGRGVSGRGAGG
ncbi:MULTISPECIES: helix-turn-helix transcriptional regulator [Actinosynnema]|uniref:helix-turn-helix transcriptional regulator n=1 Tax=Actinosynnema TaxID=40566 RepID=UPI0020A2A068|nr:helix-turn-helix transcriptional regulator [Actinosynnema pretiosum]MCP2092639.1 Helix-turn-helix domain-containing protein [Actinosynnema pretiosum]